MNKLAIIITHPIQYYAPLFRLLAKQKNIDLNVFYTWSQTKEKVIDKTFGREIKWDIPLLEGYNYEFVENISKNPGSNSWRGIDNPDLISRIENYGPNAILVFGWNMKSHFNVMRNFKGKVPVWFRGDSTLLDERKSLKTVFRRIWLTYVYGHSDKAFYVGQENKKYFLTHGLKESQLIFAPHAIDNERFFDSPEKKYEDQARQWRLKLGYTTEDIIILFAGKFEERKDPQLLISAFQELKNSEKGNFKLLLIGNGPMEEEIRKTVKENVHIQLLPFHNQSKMPIIYRLGDLFCLPSKSETWGLAVNEAMASSRPVVVSDKVGCAPDLVKGKPVGGVFSSGNVKELKNALFVVSQENPSGAGAKAKEVIENWNFENITKAIIEELR